MRASERVRGVGLHTGEVCSAAIFPAARGHGIVFEQAGSSVPVRTDCIDDRTARCTALRSGTARVQTVEHLLAAMGLLGVTDATILVEGPEIPVLDGSAEPWCRILRTCGAPGRPRLAPTRLSRFERVSIGEPFAEIMPVDKDADAFIEVCVDLSVVGRTPMVHRIYPASDSAEDIAGARTFAFAHEVEALRRAGLAKGGTLDNAVVLSEEGPLNKEPLRFEDEPARHKLVDVIGDLMPAGGIPRAQIRLFRPGHRLNHAVARMFDNVVLD